MDNYLNQVIGERYQIQEIIGIGGMSVVYKAYDPVDDRIVAVKILKDEYVTNQEFRMRFKNESKAISMLSHPNIVKVFDVSFGDDIQYIVMEYVEGITLKEYIQRQKVLDWKEAVHFAVQILRALQHAHDKGIVHRDIKPQNIILLPNANIKVTDFGIARFNRVETRNVAETSAIGSVHYVSPEQARGEYTDGRSDIYSVGVVLYEMLTGSVPFESDSDENVAMMQLMYDVPLPSKKNPSIPAGLEQITLKALQKAPADRYQSAAEFLSDLSELKRNPHMKFDYNYFVDKDPTKYINTAKTDGASQKKAEPPVRITNEPAEEDEEDEEEPEERNLTVPILLGVAIALVLIVGIIVLVAFGDPIRSLFHKNTPGTEVSEQDDSIWEKLFGWFSKDQIEVPNLFNMTFDEAKAKYPDLIFADPQTVYNTTFEANKIIEQYPQPGEKIDKDEMIQITIAINSEMQKIPDVKGKKYEAAEKILKNAGFEVVCVPAIDENTPEDEVIYTDPNINTYAAYHSTVYVYYASAVKPGTENIKVPNVMGDQIDVARSKIAMAGLRVGAIITDSSTPALKDYVIGQNPPAGANVGANYTVNLTIGNGIPENGTATIRVALPKVAGSKPCTIKTFLNNMAYDSKANVTLDGSEITLSFTGTGAENTFTIYADNSKLYSGKIDFTKPTGQQVTDVLKYSYATKEYVPDVTGLSEELAKEVLLEKGFSNVTVIKEKSDEVRRGYVISQTPIASNLTQYSTATAITLVVSAGDGSIEEPTTKNGEEPSTEPPTTEPPTDVVTEPTTHSEDSPSTP